MQWWIGWGTLWIECVAFAAGMGLALFCERQRWFLGREACGGGCDSGLAGRELTTLSGNE